MTLTQRLRSAAPALVLFGAVFGSAPALAAVSTKADAELTARFRQELAACNNGQTKQERSACIREAHAARAEARRGALGEGSAPTQANNLDRCRALAGDERTACMARMQGYGTTSGTAADGGILRELVVVEPADATKAPPK